MRVCSSSPHPPQEQTRPVSLVVVGTWPCWYCWRSPLAHCCRLPLADSSATTTNLTHKLISGRSNSTHAWDSRHWIFTHDAQNYVVSRQCKENSNPMKWKVENEFFHDVAGVLTSWWTWSGQVRSRKPSWSLMAVGSIVFLKDIMLHHSMWP